MAVVTCGAAATHVPTSAPETRWLPLQQGRLAYDDSGGSGALVVAIAGMGDLRSEYQALRLLLVRAGYRVVTMDIRGHGETSVRWDDYSARAALTANLREPGRMHALRTLIALSKADTAAIVAHSRVPALVVMGTRDPDFPDPVAEAQWLGRMLDTTPLLVDGAGHDPHLEMPQAVAPGLMQFLVRTAGR